ncbi:MAG: serine protease [Planctomycetes bacterium]|nr:serine protease [Planctomycetota bacterium]
MLAATLSAANARAQEADDGAAHDSDNVFAEAIAYAQKRCVKIYGARIGRVEGFATGVIVSDDGLILTGQGVFLSGTSIDVVLPDGSQHVAVVERRSSALQVALLRIRTKTPDFFEVPEKIVARKGDWVVAVTNLFKVAQGAEELSVSLGIVSLRTRLDAKRGTQDVPYRGEALLVDAITSNPGAEGGALVTVDGKLAGMVGKIIESKSTNTRLNYAVPSDLLHKFIAGKLIGPVVKRPTGGKTELGIRLFTLGGKRAPAYVDRVVPGSPAAEAGFKKDDLVLTINGEIVKNVRDCKKILDGLPAGEEVVILVKRKNEILRAALVPKEVKSDEK